MIVSTRRSEKEGYYMILRKWVVRVAGRLKCFIIMYNVGIWY